MKSKLKKINPNLLLVLWVLFELLPVFTWTTPILLNFSNGASWALNFFNSYNELVLLINPLLLFIGLPLLGFIISVIICFVTKWKKKYKILIFVFSLLLLLIPILLLIGFVIDTSSCTLKPC